MNHPGGAERLEPPYSGRHTHLPKHALMGLAIGARIDDATRAYADVNEHAVDFLLRPNGALDARLLDRPR